jgi:hypothetical protein
LEPPYLLVAHSFGGILLRTFLQYNVESVGGVLLFDTATEIMLSPLFPRVPPWELLAVAKNVDVEALTHLKEESRMSDEEWECAISANQRCVHALSLEDTHASAYNLALHRQLDLQVFGSRPATVVQCEIVRDYQLLYDEGVRLGDGTKEERAAAREFIERWRAFHGQIARAQMGLSKDGVFRYFGEWGHDLPIRRPAMVVDEVRGLLKRMGGDRERMLKKDVEEDSGTRVEKREAEKSKDRRAVQLSPTMTFLG